MGKRGLEAHSCLPAEVLYVITYLFTNIHRCSTHVQQCLAGLTTFNVLHRIAFFEYFISQIFIVTLFEQANKIMVI